jgi:hypothetical protein
VRSLKLDHPSQRVRALTPPSWRLAVEVGLVERLSHWLATLTEEEVAWARRGLTSMPPRSTFP